MGASDIFVSSLDAVAAICDAGGSAGDIARTLRLSAGEVDGLLMVVRDPVARAFVEIGAIADVGSWKAFSALPPHARKQILYSSGAIDPAVVVSASSCTQPLTPKASRRCQRLAASCLLVRLWFVGLTYAQLARLAGIDRSTARRRIGCAIDDKYYSHVTERMRQNTRTWKRKCKAG
ncbi:uncharacterized protein E1O_19960 [Burkholderiales bacterium GJ-E10]|nr:uncharacterized protein E1O_19960 [Burkholderiales bacterium GJ-E10]